MLASTAVQVVAGVLAAAVLGIIVYRRKQKAVVVLSPGRLSCGLTFMLKVTNTTRGTTPGRTRSSWPTHP
jgi:hypothetical protein